MAKHLRLSVESDITEEDYAMGIASNTCRLEAQIEVAREAVTRQLHQLHQVDGGYCLDCADGDDGDRVFHLFPELPGELKQMVWKQAVNCLSVPKLYEFDFDLAYDPKAAPNGRPGNGLIACFKPIRTNRELNGHVALLSACWDSRKAFLGSGNYVMVPLTYLSTPATETAKNNVKSTSTMTKSPKIIGKGRKIVIELSKQRTIKASPKFRHILLPVNFEQSCFLIDKIPNRLSYRSFHPLPPNTPSAFTQAAGLEFIHSIKKLAFSVHGDDWTIQVRFGDLFANTPDHYTEKRLPITLGALETLSYVSAKAVERRCCFGEYHFWNQFPSVDVRQFQPSQKWYVPDVYRLHKRLLEDWERHHEEFKWEWARDLQLECTCQSARL